MQFQVDEVSAGPDLAPQVWVLSGQEQSPWPLSLLSAVSSSIDAEFVTGKQYVVGASRSFSTSACSVSAAVDLPAPGEVREPSEEGTLGADPPAGPVEQALWGRRGGDCVRGGDPPAISAPEQGPHRRSSVADLTEASRWSPSSLVSPMWNCGTPSPTT